MNELKGLNAYITGASKGIGKVIAQKFAEQGVNLVIISRNLSEAQEVASHLSQTYHIQAWVFAADVSNPKQVKQLEQDIASSIKRIDIAFNSAGVCKHIDALEMSFEDWSYVLDINLTGVFLTSKMAARLMIQENIKGSIINMASMSAQIVNVPQKQCAYNASKAGVVHLTRTLAVEWAQYGIRVNSISPGYIGTEMSTDISKEFQEEWFRRSMMPRMGKPEELFSAIKYLADTQSTFTTGSNIVVDGGYVCL